MGNLGDLGEIELAFQPAHMEQQRLKRGEIVQFGRGVKNQGFPDRQKHTGVVGSSNNND
jgi:hypothetical protein